jgi:integrase
VPSVAHLTKRAIDALKAEPGARYVLWDESVPGFGVRVGKGTRTYVLKFRLASGRVRWATLGRVDVITLDEARKRAKRDLGLVADGSDPLSHHDAARGAPTVSFLANRFLDEHVEARRKKTTQRLYTLAIEKHLRPRLGTIPIADVGAADIVRLHQRLRATPYLANRVLAVASSLMSWAEVHGYRPRRSNPCDGVEKFPETARKRYLTTGELRRVGAALRVAERYGSMSPAALSAIRLLLYTGARLNEILSLKWAHVDIHNGALLLPDSKTGAKTILLNPQALEVLKARPKFAKSPYVFPGEGHGKRKGQHRVSLADPWAWVRKRARLRDVRVHDIRHSFASVGVSNGQTLPMIGALLGHSQAATTQRYAHLMADPLRAASDATGATIATALERKGRAERTAVVA